MHHAPAITEPLPHHAVKQPILGIVREIPIMTKKTEERSVFELDIEDVDQTVSTPDQPKDIYLLQAPPFYFGLYAVHHARKCYQTGNTRMKTFANFGSTTVEFKPLPQVEIIFEDKFKAWVNPEWLVKATEENILAAAATWETINRSYTPKVTDPETGKVDRVALGNMIGRKLRQQAAAAA